MELLTPRLRLRELREEDFDALYAVLGDSDIARHYPYTFDEAGSGTGSPGTAAATRPWASASGP